MAKMGLKQWSEASCAKEKVVVEDPVCVCCLLFLQGCTQCVCAHLNIDDGDGGLGLVKVSSHPVHCFWDEIQYQIQIHFIFLEKNEK